METKNHSNQITIGSKIIDTTFYSIGFPTQQDEILISRDNYITQIDDYLNQGIKLLFIDGDEDAGKTTLCSQYARLNAENVITVFFNPLNNIDYSIEFYCTNIVYQLKYLLKEEFDIEDEDVVSREEYQQYIFHTRKLQKKWKKPLTLIIDGLEEKLKGKDDFIKDLVSIVPLGQETFNVIVVASENDFRNLNPKIKALPSKTISLTGFSEPEICKYLDISFSSATENKDIYKITKGYPGRLKTLKRLLKDDYSLDQITHSTTYKNWVELDSSTVDHVLPIHNAILSLFALSDKSYTPEEVAKICSITLEEVETILQSIKILEKSNKYISFVSLSHKKYYSNLLRGNRKNIQDLLINYYASSDTINSLIELPKLYAESQDWHNIIRVIDNNYSTRIIQSTESIKTVSENLALGLLASEKVNKYTDMWRYSLESSVVNELDNYLFWESEIKARISIQDFTGAIALAESAILKVDRLRLLALVARKEKEIKNRVDEDLVNLIQQLYDTTNLESVGNKIYDIVADLIYATPNLAIEMIEKSSGNASENNINDWIIAKLSVAAIDSSLKEKEDLETSKTLAVVESLSNPEAKKINKAITFLVGNYSSQKVVDEVNKLSDSTERLRLLRLWLTNNKNVDEDVSFVIDLALNEVIASSSETAVTLDILKELSQQLPYVKDAKIKDKLYYRFKGIENSLSDLGLARNRFIYELNLFHAEFTLDKNQSILTINKLLKEIESISDKLIQLEAYTEAYAKMISLKFDELQKKINFTYSRILTLTRELFDSTANHLKVSTYILKVIGKKNPTLGLKIAQEINLQSNRESAKTLVYETYLDNDSDFISANILRQIEGTLELTKTKEEFYVSVLERYAEFKAVPPTTIRSLYYYFDKVRLFKSPSRRAFAYVQILRIISKDPALKHKETRRFENLIFTAWKQIEAEWDQIDTGFTICSDVAKINSSFAKRMFQEAVSLKKNSWIDSSPVAVTYLNNMKLVIRCFLGLVITGNVSEGDEKILTDLMNRIPSEMAKLDLWTELGFHCYIEGNDSLAKKIYNEHVVPLIEGLISKDQDIERVIDSLTFIHIFNADLVNKYLRNLSSDIKEAVYSNICDFYISKRNPFEIYDPTVDKFSCSFSDMTKAIAAFGNISTDLLLYTSINLICNSIQESKENIAKPQSITLIKSLEEVIRKKLPDQKNIKHLGYRLLAEAKISRIKRESINHNILWQSYIDQAKSIPNKSDAALVKAVLLEDIPFEKISNGNILKQELYNSVIEDLNSFVSYFDFVQRVIDLNEIMYNINRRDWKKHVEKAFSTCLVFEETKEGYKSQKKIIDTIYRLDPDFAKELIKLADNDKTEDKHKKFLHKNLEMLEISNKIKNNKVLEKNEKEEAQLVIGALLTTLKSINSGKTSAKKVNEVTPYLSLGNKLPLHEAFPAYLYYLTNCIRTYKSKSLTGAVSDIHKDNFRKAILSTNLIEILSNRKKGNEKSFRAFFIEENFVKNESIHPGTRENAVALIKNWMIDELEEFIIIADPYFKKEDLEVLKIIIEVNPNVNIDILGSKNGNDNNLETQFKDYWKSISDQQPPFTNLTFCWIEELANQAPFHDRWLITKNGGLRLGTSLNSLGKSKESEISIMAPNEALKIKEKSLLEYVTRTKKAVNNMRVSYRAFSI